MSTPLRRRYGHAARRMTASEILKAADARIDYKALGLDVSDRRVFYDKRRREWLVELNTDPALYYVARRASDGSIRLEREP